MNYNFPEFLKQNISDKWGKEHDDNDKRKNELNVIYIEWENISNEDK